MKTLFLHIGHYKTGTSAIQKFLHDNEDALAQSGTLYPQSGRVRSAPTNHAELSLTIGKDHGFNPPAWYRGTATTDEAYARFIETAAHAPQDRILVSSEEFVQLGMCADPEAAVADLKSRLAAFDVRIVLYIREPFALFKSWYGQVNKGKRPTGTFLNFFSKVKTEFLAQEGIYAAFVAGFGADKVTLKTYKDVGEAHIRGFLDIVAVTPPPGATFPIENRSHKPHDQELERLNKIEEDLYDRLTVSRVGGIHSMMDKVDEINAAYTRVAEKSDVIIESALSTHALVERYTQIITHVSQVHALNPTEEKKLREFARIGRDRDPSASEALLKAADLVKASLALKEA